MAKADGTLSVADLAAAVVAHDEGIRDDLKGLVQDMIKHMRYTMRFGEPAAKTQLSKQIIPQLLTAINKVDKDEGEEEERAAYNRMMAALRGEVIVTEGPDTTPEATEDMPVPSTPPVKKKAAARKKAARKKIAAKKAT